MNARELWMNARNNSVRAARAIKHLSLHKKYHEYTMMPAASFWRNLLIVDERRNVDGCVVECGVWRGGMSAGMAEVLGPTREYFLFDSFEGLPLAKPVDGEAAIKWQKDIKSPNYYDNCKAEVEWAEQAMKRSRAPKYNVVKGWFSETLPRFEPPCPIAILRLDGDWYESTTTALEALFKHVARDGIVIVDDYYTWDGCSRAVHDFLSRNQLTARVTQRRGICVLELRS